MKDELRQEGMGDLVVCSSHFYTQYNNFKTNNHMQSNVLPLNDSKCDICVRFGNERQAVGNKDLTKNLEEQYKSFAESGVSTFTC